MIDFNLKNNSASVSSQKDLIIQQIDILFDTDYKEVLGSDEFGTQYDDYLYRLNLSAEDIKYRVLNDLYSIELFGYIPNVEVFLLQGTEQDIALIKITLSNNNHSFEQIYKIYK